MPALELRSVLRAAPLAGLWLGLPVAAAVFDTSQIAKSPTACEDFYQHVNGTWLARTAMPPDRVRLGGFEDLRLQTTRELIGALQAGLADPARLDSAGKRAAATFFASGTNEAAIEARGLAAAQPWLSAIDALADAAQLAPLFALLAEQGIVAPLAVGVFADPLDRRRFVLSVGQGGLGLPDRDDYTRDDARAQALRAAYRSYQRTLLTLAGADATSAADAAAVAYALEERLAAASLTRLAMREPRATIHRFTLTTLAQAAPGLDWGTLLAAAGHQPKGEFNVAQPGFAAALGRAVQEVPLAHWRVYLRVRVLDALAPLLPAAFESAEFDYRGRVQQGRSQPRPRAERVIGIGSGDFARQLLGNALGQVYVAQAFSPQARASAQAMVADIKEAMRARLRALDWMSEPTRARALAKLDAMALQIGYPERFLSYDGLQLAADDYAGNWLRANAWNFARERARLGQPVDRGEWRMGAHIVNAYAGGTNEIVFPAAILRPPFFYADGDAAINFGAIGMVIGHEITHHFDDRGRQFDESGSLADWWTAPDAERYRARAQQVVQQYDGYKPLAGMTINGQLTLGENISDLSGIAIAYDGLQRVLARAGAPARAPIDGYTPEQRFFLSFALMWREQARDEFLAQQLRIGQHSPPRYRVIGVLSNFTPFAAAFACGPGSFMRASGERVSIW